jgi:hypothetical protein
VTVDLTGLERRLFGWTRESAHAAGLCIRCSKPVDIHALSDLDHIEYGISAFCPACYEEVMPEDEE